MTIADRVAARGVTEVLHFTTSNGALGTLAEQALVPRAQLKQSELLEFIIKHNTAVRKDPHWAGHSSLSLTRINSKFFEFSHRTHGVQDDLWWCILSFSPAVLSHPDVVFVTGNNTWPNAIKKKGADGFEHLFAEKVPGTYGTTITRPTSLAAHVPTCPEAEVLYPGRLAIEHLQRVYFREQANADQFLAQARTLDLSLPDSIAIVSDAPFKG